MSFLLVGAELLSRWYATETDAEAQARMDEWLADLLDAPWSPSHDEVPGPNALLRVALVPGTDWAVEFLINDGARQIELKRFIAM